MEINLKAKDGLNLYGVAYGNSKNIIVAIHSGGFDHNERGRYPISKKDGHNVYKYLEEGVIERLTRLVKDDYMVIAFDLRNHGKSGVDGVNLISKFSSDFEVIMDYIDTNYDYNTIHIFGLCIGALIGSIYASKHKVNSLTVWSPLYVIEENFINVKKENTFAYNRKQNMLKGIKNKMANGYDNEESYKELEELNKENIPRQLEEQKVKTLFLSGNNDALINFNDLLKYKEILKSAEFHEMDGGSHCLYNEPVLTEALNYTINFIKRNS